MKATGFAGGRSNSRAGEHFMRRRSRWLKRQTNAPTEHSIPMHFSLRTLLVVITAVAVYIGFHLGMIRTFYGRNALTASGLFGMLYHLPLFIIWSVAAASIYPVRRKIPHANLVLAAILLAFVWQLTSPFAQLVFFRFLQSGNSSFQSGGASLVSTNALRWYGSAFAVIEGVVEAVCWGLILYAYVKTGALAVSKSSSGLPASEASQVPLASSIKNNIHS